MKRSGLPAAVALAVLAAGCTLAPPAAMVLPIATPVISFPAADPVPRASSTTEPLPTTSAATGAVSSTIAPPAIGSAAAVLAGLPVKGRAPRTDYDRDQFGQAWSDDVRASGGRNGCDQRNDVLRRDLIAITLKPGTRGCVVLTGTLDDPYSGALIAFVRGPNSADVQIDHVVALSDAWQSGAQQLPEDRRRDLAGDPLNLWAVGGRLNQSKGASNAASWLPPNRAVRCAYVARQVAVKQRYDLWVTVSEKDAIARVLTGCPGEPLPTETSLGVPDLG